MGSEQSQIPGIQIEDKAVEVSDFWSQHSASIYNSETVTSLTVFVGEIFVNGPLWINQTPLEKSRKNLMIHRHPCIVKYISSWQKNSKYFLAVEEVKPLSNVLSSLNSLQICIGLHSILKALHFLHQKAFVSHNNICSSSIYVTSDGSWKLGGMEYLCKFSELNCDYLGKCRSNRYHKAVDPNEDKNILNTNRKDCVDVYAFLVLSCEILQNKNDDDIHSLTDFRELCEKSLKNSILERPSLDVLLNHDFFNHDFIAIYSFLIELPLKSDEEKSNFFNTLVDKLKSFDEVIVGRQLGGLLLSRMVLLNQTAQLELLPVVLSPRIDSSAHSIGIFSSDTFKMYISPKLLEIFTVRDAQIRLLLLNHFPNFIHTFTKEELQAHILPELLVGIKDTNDHLVSVTLRTLADLIPILGASTVVGGKRAKLFNDGRPIQHTNRLKESTKGENISQLPVNLERSELALPISLIESNAIDLPERPRPDGEEGDTSTEDVEQSVDEDLDNWEDWDVSGGRTENLGLNIAAAPDTNGDEEILSQNISNLDEINISSDINLPNSINSNIRKKSSIPDILELDIKNQLTSDSRNISDIDFFQDMEPVIDKSTKFLIEECELVLDKNIINKFTLNCNESNEDGWEDDEWE